MQDKPPHLKRKRYPMPDYVHEALLKEDLMEAYLSRPPYQQNDYIGWIIHAVKEETKQRRLDQMIEELKAGNVYMKMEWKPKS
ncbi:MAG: YdeI/OmpD-associated family protein [Halobacteriota archaeon]|nr:YdeI/OmpD-associated family protein [Halobacteriota archaeon]